MVSNAQLPNVTRLRNLYVTYGYALLINPMLRNNLIGYTCEVPGITVPISWESPPIFKE